MLVAKIAENVLQQESPSVYQKALSLLSPLSKWCGEDKYPFIEAATWPDKIKQNKNYEMGDWHFVNQLISIDETPITTSMQIENHNPGNVTAQIRDGITTLKTPDDSADHNPYWGKQNATLVKSMMLRDLIHFVGDVHQPLHALEGVFSQEAKGDRGGNYFKTWYKDYEGKQLHFYWDHMFYQYDLKGDGSTELESPLPEAKHKLAVKYASGIMKEFPKSYFGDKKVKNLWAQDWADEDMDLAKSVVYKLNYDEEMTSDYVEIGRRYTRERVAIGGYRLAEALKKALGEKAEEKVQMSVLA